MYRCCAVLLLVVGVAARLYLYLWHKDLWIDEAWLAESIWNADMRAILGGNLRNMQSAPLGFMVLTKLLARVFGTSEHVLYAIPALSGTALLLVLWRFIRAEFGRQFGIVYLAIYMACLVASFPLLYYSSEFKPYSTECLFAALFLVAWARCQTELLQGVIPRPLIGLACAAVLFSSTSVFVGAGMGLSLFWISRKRLGRLLRNNAGRLLFAAIFLLLYYALYLRRSGTTGMYRYWDGFFVPVDPRQWPAFFADVLGPVFAYCLELTPWAAVNLALLAVSFCGGMVFLYRERFTLFLPVALTGLVLVLASMAGIYPIGHAGDAIGTRLVLFCFPLMFFPCALFFYRLSLWIIARKPAVFAVALLCLTAFVVLKNGIIMYRGTGHEQTSALIASINTQYDQSSALTLHSMAVPAYGYYQHRSGKSLPFTTLDRDAVPEAEVDKALQAARAGGKRRVFFLFSHHLPEFYERCAAHLQNQPGVQVERAVQNRGAVLLVINIAGDGNGSR